MTEDVAASSVTWPGRATYRVVVEYDGTEFHGFQYQRALRTVGGELAAALGALFGERIALTVAGRTDAGVHASGQVVSFVAHDRFPVERLAIALNSRLPPDLTARDAAVAAPGFSARFDAVQRRYGYTVLNRRHPSAVLRRWSHFEHRALALAPMRLAAAALVGTHDFTTFCATLPDRGGPVRTIHTLTIERQGELVRLDIAGNGFLHRMIRIVAGTLLAVGAGEIAPEAVAAMLAARDRRVAGPTASPQGLVLLDVVYPGFSSGASRDGALATGRRSD